MDISAHAKRENPQNSQFQNNSCSLACSVCRCCTVSLSVFGLGKCNVILISSVLHHYTSPKNTYDD